MTAFCILACQRSHLLFCQHQITLHGNYTLKPCADSVFWNVHITDFTATRFHLCSLLFQIHRRPLQICESRFRLFLVSHAFLAACGKIFTSCPQSPFSWANRVAFSQHLRRELPLRTFSIQCLILFYFIHLFIYVLLGGSRSCGDTGQVSLDQLPGRRKRPKECLKGEEK